ncbi:hypothetical protein ACA910_005122 [Epithemia clementina (nom. ined.)]
MDRRPHRKLNESSNSECFSWLEDVDKGKNSNDKKLCARTFEQERLDPAATVIRKKPRVLPSSQVLISTVDGGRSPCPLIQELLRSTGKTSIGVEHELSEKPSVDDDDNTQDQSADGPTADFHARSIDDKIHSCLNSGHHRRFAQLTEAKATRLPQTKSEYNKIRAIIQSEQSRYLEALRVFWQEQKERLSIGFRGNCRASKFVELATKRNMNLNAWLANGLPARYGKYCQIISFSMVPPASSVSLTSNVLDSVGRELVSNRTTESESFSMENFMRDASEVPLPTTDEGVAETPLFSDKEALQLAREHCVDLVVSDTTLELLMRADDVGSWLVPTIRMSSPSNLLIVGEPTIKTFSCPRECLSRGFRESLVNKLHQGRRTTDANNKQNSSKMNRHYDYVVLSLPPVRQKKHRVLVRRDRELVRDNSGLFVRLHAHTEYFPERGLEIPSASDKALWMLDFLLEPSSRVVVAKIDPSTCTVARWEEVSLAHTLTQNDSSGRILSDSEASCIDRWHNLLHLLTALPMVGHKKHVLCYPGQVGERRSFPSISVHLLDDEGEFSISDMLKGGEVPLDYSAFRRCYRPWQWGYDRTPYTFPFKED